MRRASELDGLGSFDDRVARATPDQENDVQGFVVTEAPRQHAETLLPIDSPTFGLDFVANHVRPQSKRLMPWWPDETSLCDDHLTPPGAPETRVRNRRARIARGLGRHGSLRSRKARDAMQDFVVTEAPRRHERTILQTDRLDMALGFVERHVGPPSTRMVLWWPDEPSTAGPEVAVAVPLGVYQDVVGAAARIVELWDASWRPFDSASQDQRDATRAELVGAIAVGLLSAAVTGLDEAGDHFGI